MSLFKSGNPTLTEKMFQGSSAITDGGVMTVRGTMNKFGFLFLMVLASAAFTWNAYEQGTNIFPWMMVGAIGGLVLALVMAFKQVWSPYLSPAYALLEGLFVGGISAYFNDVFASSYPGIIMQAVLLTLGTGIGMYLLYRYKIIQPTQKFKAIVMTATAGIAFFYLIAFGLSFAGITIPFLHEGSTFGIIFSLIVVALAAMNLILDFDMIEQGSAMGAPKYMEWYGAFGLLVTIVWLYLEILRLLSKLASRN
jgi:uncharacterized YccA/Bax inhibitor family protein